MEVIIVSCKDCVFAQNAQVSIVAYLEKMAEGLDGQEGTFLRPQCYDLQDIHHQTVAVAVRKAKVQIIIITHFMLEQLKSSGVKNYCRLHLKRVLHSNGVIAILSGIRAEDILGNHLDMLPHFSDWNVLELRGNRKGSKFFNTFSEHVFRSYNSRTKHNETPLRPSTAAVNGDHGRAQLHLSLAPPTTPGTHRLVVQIEEKVCPADEIRILLKRGELELEGLIRIPEEADTSEGLEIQAPIESLRLNSQIVRIQTQIDPIEAMIERFPGYKKYLDETISEALLNCFETDSSVENLMLLNQMRQERADEFPNILHFAVYYGLERTVLTILEKGEGQKLCDARNKSGETPLELAERRGFEGSIGKTIRDYEEVWDSWEAIQYLKKFCQPTDPEKMEEEAKDSIEELGQPQNAAESDADAASSFYNAADIENSFQNAVNIENSSENAVDIEKSSGNAVDIENSSVNAVDTENSFENAVNIENSFENESVEEDPYVELVLSEKVPVKAPRARPPVPVSSNYDFPPSEARPVLPPKSARAVLLKKDPTGTLKRDSGNYLAMMNQLETTLPRGLSQHRIRESISSVSTLTDDEEEPVPAKFYNKPLPIPTPESPLPKALVLLDPREEELKEIMRLAHAKIIDKNDLEDILTKFKRRSDVKKDIEERELELARMKAEYHAKQERRGSRDTNFWDRLFRGRKKSSAAVPVNGRPKKVTPPQNTPTSTSPSQASVNGFTWPQQLSKDDLAFLGTEVMRSFPPTEPPKVWGNVMDRKCVAISYIEPNQICTPQTQTTDQTELKNYENILLFPDPGTPDKDSENTLTVEHDPAEATTTATTEGEFLIPDKETSLQDAMLATVLREAADEPDSAPSSSLVVPKRPAKRSMKVATITPPDLQQLELQPEPSLPLPPKPKPRVQKVSMQYINYARDGAPEWTSPSSPGNQNGESGATGGAPGRHYENNTQAS